MIYLLLIGPIIPQASSRMLAISLADHMRKKITTMTVTDYRGRYELRPSDLVVMMGYVPLALLSEYYFIEHLILCPLAGRRQGSNIRYAPCGGCYLSLLATRR